MARLVSRADFAKLARVTKPAITKAAKKQLAAAFVEDRIDIDHAAARAYLAARGVTGAELERALGGRADDAPTEKPKAGKKSPAKPTAPGRKPPPVTRLPPGPPPEPPPKPRRVERQIPLPESMEELDEFSDAIRPLIARFGTSRTFQDWLGSLKLIEEIQAKNLQNQETEGKLIARSLVETHVFGAIDALARTLLRDAPKTITRKLFPLAKTGANVEAGERIVEGLIGQAFQSMKAQAIKALDSA
jgi:hypothetical protein